MTPISPDAKKRASDFSAWLRIAEILAKYRIVVWIIFLAFIAFGFDFKTPAQAFDEVRKTQAKHQAQIDTLFRRDDQKIVLLKEVDTKLDKLLRYQCLNATAREAVTLDCRR